MRPADNGPNLMERSIRASIWTSLALVALLLPAHPASAVSLAAGECIMAANLFFLGRLVKLFTERGRGARELPMLGLGLAKTALVYGGAFALTRWRSLDYLPLLLGLSMPFLTLLLKSIMQALGYGPSPLSRRATQTAGPAGPVAKLAAILLLSGAVSLGAPAPAHAAGEHEAASVETPGAAAQEGHDAAAPEAHDGAAIEHLPNWVILLNDYFPHNPVVHWMHENEVLVFAWVAGLVFFLYSWLAMRRSRQSLVPGPLQNSLEWMVESMESVTGGMLGRHNHRYFPYIMAIFFYILSANLIGIVPGFKSSTDTLDATLALALVTFLYVQWSGIRNLGPLGYLDHLAGSPRDIIGFAMLPIMIPVHVLGELAKPVSLSCRLFGNIFGEDTLVVVFVSAAALCLKASLLALGLPPLMGITALFMLLQTLTSIVQALIFALLTSVYFYMMLPHEEHAAGEVAHAHGH
jgi:F-type H+-transporting ATPase subunit a